MKKSSTLIALAAAASLTACEQKTCLEQGYDTTLRLIESFNEGRCEAVFNGDRRQFDCPEGKLAGRINGRVFELKMDAPFLHYDINRSALEMRCATTRVELSDQSTLRELENRFKQALAQIEVD